MLAKLYPRSNKASAPGIIAFPRMYCLCQHLCVAGVGTCHATPANQPMYVILPALTWNILIRSRAARPIVRRAAVARVALKSLKV